jgi:hypothetical protein
MGDCLLWAVFLMDTFGHFGQLFFLGKKFIINFDQKMGWAAFWDEFLQTHLVTLLLNGERPKMRPNFF